MWHENLLIELVFSFIFVFFHFYSKNDLNSFRSSQHQQHRHQQQRHQQQRHQQHRHQAQLFVFFVTTAKKDVERSWLILLSLKVTKYHYRSKISPKI